MSRFEQRCARLVAEYGFPFPDHFFRFWDFVCRLQPLDPLHALSESLGVVLVGPYEILSGRFDGRVPRRSLLLHWRYHDDPPEFFTVLAGSGDGLHWGLYLDDPGQDPGCVASYFARDAYEISADGDSLFDALRLHLENHHADIELDRENGASDEAEASGDLALLDQLRHRLMAVATGDRSERGDEYTERYAGVCRRAEHVVADTMEGMGIVVPAERYRPLSVTGRRLWKQLRRGAALEPFVEEARQALKDGYPGAALELGRNLWACVGAERSEAAMELLDEAYASLGRESLRRVLQTHRVCRDLPSVDILEVE